MIVSTWIILFIFTCSFTKLGSIYQKPAPFYFCDNSIGFQDLWFILYKKTQMEKSNTVPQINHWLTVMSGHATLFPNTAWVAAHSFMKCYWLLVDANTSNTRGAIMILLNKGHPVHIHILCSCTRQSKTQNFLRLMYLKNDGIWKTTIQINHGKFNLDFFFLRCSYTASSNIIWKS